MTAYKNTITITAKIEGNADEGYGATISIRKGYLACGGCDWITIIERDNFDPRQIEDEIIRHCYAGDEAGDVDKNDPFFLRFVENGMVDITWDK